ncbi:MAG: sulfatase-like hydrolase/transferase [Bacteroidetes bacterium]|nr:sulfatase-like hydrolase/transferase [Bacteroidota bacterium]
MKKVLLFGVLNFICWFLLFQFSRIVFLTFTNGFHEITSSEILNSFRFGIRLDLSMSAYITFLLTFTSVFAAAFSVKTSKLIFKTLYFLIAIITAIAIGADARLYNYWGAKLDMKAMQYLAFPREAAASLQVKDLLLFALIFILFFGSTWLLWRFVLKKTALPKTDFTSGITALLICGILIIPIRGGLDVSTLNLSSAYHSRNQYANHVSVNTVWNAVFSILNRSKTRINTDGISFPEAMMILKKHASKQNLFPFDLPDSTNVVVIVLESYSARLISQLNGRDDVAPRMQEYIKQGWLFDNFYSNGDRSHQGLTALFTGFPGNAETEILKHPDKLLRLPNLMQDFTDAGYHTSMTYGGNLEFANIQSIFSVANRCSIYDKSYFSKFDDLKKGKWGVHDEHTFDHLLKICTQQPEPFLNGIFSLSNHEPFDIPEINKTFDDPLNKLFKAAWYTDSCIGAFLDAFSKTERWKHTLVVITADHAIPQPGDLPIYHPDKFHIPLILLGGAIKQPQVFHQFASHVDIPATLSKWVLKERENKWMFSRSLFDTPRDESYFFYNLGSGIICRDGCVVYDYIADKDLYRKAEGNDLKLMDELEVRNQNFTKAISVYFKEL